MLAFKSWLKVTLREELIPDSVLHNEILVVDVFCQRLGKLCFILCYRPPNDFSDEFLTNFKTTLNRCAEANFSNICLLNMPNIDWNGMVPLSMSLFDSEMCILFQELNFVQSNFSPSTKHGNILDIILTTFPQRITDIRCEEDIIGSDH